MKNHNSQLTLCYYCLLPSGDLDEDLFPSLDFLHVCRHSENAGWRLVNLAILNDDAAGS